MTQPGYVIPPRPGWWVRTDRSGIGSGEYGWDANALAEVDHDGYGSGDYGWATGAATGLNTFPTFDAIGAGVWNSAAASWNHTAQAGALVLTDVISERANGLPSATFGGLPMLPLAIVNMPGGNNGPGFIARFALANAPGGLRSAAFSGGNLYYGANSMSYTGVRSIGPPLSASGAGANASQLLSPQPGQRAVQGLGCAFGSGTGVWTPSGGTTRFNQGVAGYEALCIRDTGVAATLSATSTAAYWAALANILSGSAYASNPAFESVGDGGATTGTTLSHQHNIGPSANWLFAGMQTLSDTPSVSVGSIPMTRLAAITYSSTPRLDIFGLANPPTGLQTINYAGLQSASNANTVAYSGVSFVSLAMSSIGSGTSLAQAIPAALAPLTFQIFGSSQYGPMSAYNQNQRWNNGIANTGFALIIGDAPSYAGANFTASTPNAFWGGLAMSIF